MMIMAHYAVYLVIACNSVLFTIVENHEGYATLVPMNQESVEKLAKIMSDPETEILQFENEDCPMDVSA